MYIKGTTTITDRSGKPIIQEIYKRSCKPCVMENGRIKQAKRSERQKPTPEAMRRYNAIVAQRKLIRKINANFTKGDLYLTLTYPRGKRPVPEKAKKDLTKFIAALRREFQRQGRDLEWVARTEIGAQGAIHHHVIIPKIDAETVERLWNRYSGGHAHIVSMYGRDFSLLATYLCKPLPENSEQMTLLPEDEVVTLNYRCSRNLYEPPEHKRTCRANSWRKDPVVPDGWYLDKDSYIQGVNPITGRGYQYYRIIRLE